MAAVYPFFLVAISSLCLLLNLVFNDRRLDDAVQMSWGRISCWMFGVKVKAIGLENLPPGGCLFLFNHTSFFDIFAMAAVIRGFRFGAKIELFSIPVFGAAMRRMGVLPIDRRNREQVFSVYREAQERMRSGSRFALAPEGTRQTEEKLGPFKSGPFVFAINTAAPVVPVIIRNASMILPKHHLIPNGDTWTREVTVRLLPSVSTDGVKISDRPQLQEKVRNQMLPYF